MNTDMSYNTAHDQFMFANIVRAIGQPFTIVPVTGLAVATLARKDAGDGSALFNIFRNVGGSVGIAMLSTLVTRREQFHDLRIGERVTPYDLATQARVASGQQNFIRLGFDPATALNQSYAAIQHVIQRDANIMAFNDAFLMIGVCLLVGAALVWFCRRPEPGAAAPAH
jgi:DHA2 family multidrug resistance protein